MTVSSQQKPMTMDTATEIVTTKSKDNRTAIEQQSNNKAIEQELGCKFIRTDPDKEGSDIFKTVNEIFRNIKQSTQKTLINKISTRLLRLEFKSDSIIK